MTTLYTTALHTTTLYTNLLALLPYSTASVSLPVPLSAANRLFHSTVSVCNGGGALLGMLGHLLCKSPLRFFPPNTAPVIRCVVSRATTALMLFPRGTASTDEVGAPTRDAPSRLSAVRIQLKRDGTS